MSVVVIPDSAPFSSAQRAWLNGFLAGVLGLQQPSESGASADAVAAAEDFPWHDPTLALDERMGLATGAPVERQLMAAMGQLDCGQCGHLCQTYAELIAQGAERDLGKCVPGGKPTARKLKELLALQPAPTGSDARVIPIASIAQAPAADAAPGTSREHPYYATLLASEALNAAGAEKQTQNVVIGLGEGAPHYEPGDALGVWADNYPEEVDLLLTILRARGSEQVVLGDATSTTAREALTRHCDLRVPSDELYELLARSAHDPSEAAALRSFAEDESRAQPYGVHDVFDALVKFRSARPPVAEFAAALARLQPRLYSIASSLKRHPGQVHLTIAVVRYALHRRDYGGVASNFFASRLRAGQRVPIYIQRSHAFRLPADLATPVIMVGPGTGIAPFRAFLQERAATRACGRNWLLFGNQRRDHDFLYAEELEGYLRDGVLTHLITAFSRDQPEKIYVQHRMLEYGAEIWQWLESGAHFYVCGDAQRMARDVDEALTQICAEHGKMPGERAAAYVAELARDRRYQRDVY